MKIELEKRLTENDRTGSLFVSYSATAEIYGPRIDAEIGESMVTHEAARRRAYRTAAQSALITARELSGLGGLSIWDELAAAFRKLEAAE